MAPARTMHPYHLTRWPSGKSSSDSDSDIATFCNEQADSQHDAHFLCSKRNCQNSPNATFSLIEGHDKSSHH